MIGFRITISCRFRRLELQGTAGGMMHKPNRAGGALGLILLLLPMLRVTRRGFSLRAGLLCCKSGGLTSMPLRSLNSYMI